MGMPAARVGDQVSHPLTPFLAPGPGSSNVMIGGMPAWRALPAGTPIPEPPSPPEPPEPTEEEKEEEAEMTDKEKEERQKEREEEAGKAHEEESAALMMSVAGAADMHVCAQPSPVPFCVDGPGFVFVGSSTVMINGLPAARQGDIVEEILGPPNPIVMGCPTVNIGG